MRNLIVLGVVAITACSGAEQSAGNKQLPAMDAGRWQIEQMDGKALASPDGAWIEVDLQKGAIVASAGCNRLQARYDGKPESFTMGPVAATKKGCPDDLMAQERRLTEMLGAATSLKVDDEGVLWLSGSRGMLKARQASP